MNSCLVAVWITIYSEVCNWLIPRLLKHYALSRICFFFLIRKMYIILECLFRCDIYLCSLDNSK